MNRLEDLDYATLSNAMCAAVDEAIEAKRWMIDLYQDLAEVQLEVDEAMVAFDAANEVFDSAVQAALADDDAEDYDAEDYVEIRVQPEDAVCVKADKALEEALEALEEAHRRVEEAQAEADATLAVVAEALGPVK